jgi:phosphoglycolate phosphatase
MIGLVVFDLDGTLVDSSLDIANAANALIEELGGTRLSKEAIVGMVGEGAGLLVRRALKAASLDADPREALDRFLALYSPRLLDHTVPYDGMVDALKWIGERTPMAVLTNKPARATGLILDGLGLRGYFGEVIGGDMAWGRKPDPAGLLHLAAAAGVPPERTLLVGDSPIDLATARRAGTHICLARYGFGYRFSAADFRGDELFADAPGDIVALLSGMKQQP